MAMGWTDEKKEKLRELLADGLSANEVAAEMTTWREPVSRNAVIGMARRLGLPLNGAKPASPGPKPRLPYAGQEKRGAKKEENKPAPEPLPEPMPLALTDRSVRNVVELRDHHCRYPSGTPGREDFFYCGQDAVAGLPYCAAHAGLCYAVPVARNRLPRPRFNFQ